MDKDTYFSGGKTTINCRGRLLDLRKPLLMGVLNVTPDSFFDGGRYLSEKEIVERTGKMLSEGASVIDIGGCSTRPGAENVDERVELGRVIPAVSLVRKEFPESFISIDTFRSSVASAAADKGADIINDISGGSLDKEMFGTAAALRMPYILTHIRGTPEKMQEDPSYDDVVKEVFDFFSDRIKILENIGVRDIIIDPGFGFGKTTEHNYMLLKNLSLFGMLGKPLMAGLSRKSMINRVLGVKPAVALNGTTVLNTIALLNGVSVLRVHDVKEASEAVKIVKYYRNF